MVCAKHPLEWNRTGENDKSVFRGEDDTLKWDEKLWLGRGTSSLGRMATLNVFTSGCSAEAKLIIQGHTWPGFLNRCLGVCDSAVTVVGYALVRDKSR